MADKLPVPIGWRPVKVGEVVKQGDQFWCNTHWSESTSAIGKAYKKGEGGFASSIYITKKITVRATIRRKK